MLFLMVRVIFKVRSKYFIFACLFLNLFVTSFFFVDVSLLICFVIVFLVVVVVFLGNVFFNFVILLLMVCMCCYCNLSYSA